MRSLQILEPDAGLGQVLQQSGDAGALPLGIVGVDQLVPIRHERELVAGELGRKRIELLMQLHFKEGSRRMSDLADALLLSRGGATRVVARAEEDGLVRREIPAHDRRATYAVLTDAGREAAERAYPVYLELVQRLFHDFVDDDEIEVLVRVWNRVLEHNDMTCGPVAHAAEALEARR